MEPDCKENFFYFFLLKKISKRGENKEKIGLKSGKTVFKFVFPIKKFLNCYKL